MKNIPAIFQDKKEKRGQTKHKSNGQIWWGTRQIW